MITPNNEDMIQIQELLEGVSWGDECEICYKVGTGRALLHCGLYILLPCHWTQFEQERDRILQVGDRFNKKAGVIFYGEAPEYDCHRLLWDAYQLDLVVYWNGAANQLDQSQFIVRGLEGLNIWNVENWKPSR